jgi:hypothetical protein
MHTDSGLGTQREVTGSLKNPTEHSPEQPSRLLSHPQLMGIVFKTHEHLWKKRSFGDAFCIFSSCMDRAACILQAIIRDSPIIHPMRRIVLPPPRRGVSPVITLSWAFTSLPYLSTPMHREIYTFRQFEKKYSNSHPGEQEWIRRTFR